MLFRESLKWKPIMFFLPLFLIAIGCGGGGGGGDSSTAMDSLQRWYRDLDNDGYGDGSLKISVSQPAGYINADDLIEIDGDCNDMNVSVNPGSTENCTDLIDEDCDGKLNNDCAAPADVENFCQSGTPLPEAVPFSATSYSHPFYIGSTSIVHQEWNYLLPTGWSGLEPSDSELILCLNEYTESRGTCAYTNGTVLEMFQYYVDIAASDASSGNLFVQATINGTAPPRCPDQIVSGGGADHYGSQVSLIDMFDAVKLFTNSKPLRIDHIGGESFGICAGDDSIWVSANINEGADDTLSQLDTVGDIQAHHSIYLASDLAYDGDHIWALRSSSYSITKYNLSGNEVQSFDSIYASPHGIAFDGQNLLVFCGFNEIYSLGIDGSLTKQADTPTYSDVTAMAYYNDMVWVAEGSKIHRLSPDGTHLETKIFKGVSIDGLDVDDNQLFITIQGQETVFVYPLIAERFSRRELPVRTVDSVAHSMDNMYYGYIYGTGSEAQYRVKMTSESGEESTEVTLEAVLSPNGLAFDGESLWVNNGYYLTQHRLTDGSQIGFVNLPDDPDENNGSKIPCGQITFAEGTFWALSSRPSSKRIFQFSTAGQLIQQIPAPIDNLSGITFDGEYLWVSHVESNRTYKIATNGDVKLSLPSPGVEPSLLYFSENVLSVIDTATYEIIDWQVSMIGL